MMDKGYKPLTNLNPNYQPIIKEIKTLLTSISTSGGSFSPTNSAVRLNTFEVMSKSHLIIHYIYERLNIHTCCLQTQRELGCTYVIPDSRLPFPQTLKLFCLFNFRSKQPTKSKTTLTGNTNKIKTQFSIDRGIEIVRLATTMALDSRN